MGGYLLVAVSAITFSAKGIFAKLIYGYGVDPTTLLALRFAMALPLFWITLYFYPSGKTGLKDLAMIVLSGVLGLYLAALSDFYGLLYIEASLERVILYTYPAMVVVWTAIFFKERLSKRKVLSILVTYAGLMLVLKVFTGSIGRSDLVGALLVLCSALIYSFSYIITEVVSRRVSGVKISTYMTTAAAFAFLGTWRGKTAPEEPGAWALLIVLAIVSTYVPVLTITLGIKRIGAGKAALVSFIGPVSTAILAYLILGERLEPVQIIGMCLVMAGVLALTLERPRKESITEE